MISILSIFETKEKKEKDEEEILRRILPRRGAGPGKGRQDGSGLDKGGDGTGAGGYFRKRR